MTKKDLLESIRANKIGLFAEKENVDQVFEWVQAAIPEETGYRPAIATALGLYHNTLLEQLCQQLELLNITDEEIEAAIKEARH